MGMSINTNAGAMVALQNLSDSTRRLEMTQLRVTTGLKVSGPKDDAATFAIAQNMRGDIAGMGAVRTNLALGLSIVNVAIDAGKAVADLLTEMKAQAVQASQEGLDSDSYDALHEEFTSLRAQIESIVAPAEFNGKNLINSASTDLKVLSTVDGSTITVSKQSLDTTTLGILTVSLSDATVAATALAAINTAIINVSNALASLGSGAKRVEIQGDFTGKLIDILKQGVGNLVDADLSQESANLQAFQIKQQLGVQALAIANQGPQAILQLFNR